MRSKSVLMMVLLFVGLTISCNMNRKVVRSSTVNDEAVQGEPQGGMYSNDTRISLQLNPMQKQHQLHNMRSHLEAVQRIISLLSKEDYMTASQTAYTQLGSTTEMRMMCASFGDKGFEQMGLAFHESADAMSEVFKERNSTKALDALSTTLRHCVQCHATYRQ